MERILEVETAPAFDAPPDLAMIPTVFHFGLSGWPPPGANGFEWDGSRLSFSYWSPSVSCVASLRDRVMVPTPGQWQGLWRLCDREGIWSWPEWQGDLGVFDGLEYHLEFSVGNRSVKSRGQAAGDTHLTNTIMAVHETLQTFIPDKGELDRQCLLIAVRKKVEHAREAAKELLAGIEHTRRCRVLWERVRKGGCRCPGCGNSVFRLSEGVGLNTCVICRHCGRSFVEDAAL